MARRSINTNKMLEQTVAIQRRAAKSAFSAQEELKAAEARMEKVQARLETAKQNAQLSQDENSRAIEVLKALGGSPVVWTENGATTETGEAVAEPEPVEIGTDFVPPEVDDEDVTSEPETASEATSDETSETENSETEKPVRSRRGGRNTVSA